MVEDVTTDFRFSTDNHNELKKIFRSLVAAPLVSGDKVIGILRMDNTREFMYTQDDLRLLDIIASLSAISIENADLYARTQELAIRDGLTGLFIRRYFIERFDEEVKRASRNQSSFSLLMIDIDNFKVINYRFGHHTGDKLLCSVTDTIRKSLRKVDLVSRFGGDEFTVLLPETGAEAAQVVLSRIRNVLLNIMEKNEWPVTFTFGTVTFLKAPSSVEEMMKKVGSVMYSGKDSGMNTIEHEIVSA